MHALARCLAPTLAGLALFAAACGGAADDAVHEAAVDEAADDAAEPTTASELDSSAETETSADAVTADAVTDDADTETAEPEPAPSDESAGEGVDGPVFDFAAVDEHVGQFVESADLNGAGLIIVHRDLGVIHHEHWGVFDEDRISLIASSSKMVTAGVLLHLADQGLIDIDAPIADYVDWGAGNPEITTAQLLSNSSGLLGLLDPNPYSCMWVSATTLQECAAEIMTTDADDDGVIAPDTEFRYGGAQWQVAGAVAEVVSGKSWYELIDEIYVQPCGLDVFGYNSHFDQIETAGFSHPPGFQSDPGQLVQSENPNMEGGAYSNTADYGALLLMHLRDGMCGDTQVLSTESLARMHGDRIGDVYGGNAFGSGSGYGMGWWVDRTNGHISDGGAFGSTPWLDLEDGYGVLVLTESNSGTSGALADEIRDMIDSAIADGLAAR